MLPKESEAKASAAADRCLKAKGYISMVDVLLEMGKLTREDHERWRFRQVPYLERVVQGSLTQLDLIVRGVRRNSLHGGLKPSRTVYTSWGKGRRQPLRFTKTGNPFLEEAYSTHYVSPGVARREGSSDRHHAVKLDYANWLAYVTLAPVWCELPRPARELFLLFNASDADALPRSFLVQTIPGPRLQP